LYLNDGSNSRCLVRGQRLRPQLMPRHGLGPSQAGFSLQGGTRTSRCSFMRCMVVRVKQNSTSVSQTSARSSRCNLCTCMVCRSAQAEFSPAEHSHLTLQLMRYMVCRSSSIGLQLAGARSSRCNSCGALCRSGSIRLHTRRAALAIHVQHRKTCGCTLQVGSSGVQSRGSAPGRLQDACSTSRPTVSTAT
jgi:hypothetical protein